MNVPQFRNVSTCRNCGDIFRIHPLIHHSREHENREEKSTRVPGWLRTLETPIRNVEIEILVFTKSNLSTRLRDKFWIDLSKFWSNLSGARHYVLCAHVAWFFFGGLNLEKHGKFCGSTRIFNHGARTPWPDEKHRRNEARHFYYKQPVYK